MSWIEVRGTLKVHSAYFGPMMMVHAAYSMLDCKTMEHVGCGDKADTHDDGCRLNILLMHSGTGGGYARAQQAPQEKNDKSTGCHVACTLEKLIKSMPASRMVWIGPRC